jgi:hypothetical protein
MTKLDDINTQIRVLLDDSAATRFSDNLLNLALSQAFEVIHQRVPRILSAEHAVTIAGRDQPLPALTGCRYLISVTLLLADGSSRALEPESGFTYTLDAGTPTLHFLGSAIPAAGERLNVEYCAGYSIEGYAGGTSTTLPAGLENALIEGSTARACILRAGSLAEGYGRHGDESARLMEIGGRWEQSFARALDGFKTLQEFGFPPGFPLDRWDGVRR